MNKAAKPLDGGSKTSAPAVTGSGEARCSYCGEKTDDLVWTGDDEGYACKDCEGDDWWEAFDVCKHGGPAPCIDDVCHALGGCMYYESDVANPSATGPLPSNEPLAEGPISQGGDAQ